MARRACGPDCAHGPVGLSIPHGASSSGAGVDVGFPATRRGTPRGDSHRGRGWEATAGARYARGTVTRADLEQSLSDALARGAHDEAAERALRGYGPEILGYLIRILGSRGEAADAFSFFAEQLWKGLPGFAGRSSVRVWAYQVAWRCALRVRSEAWVRRRERFPTSMASRIAGEVLSRTAEEREQESAQLAKLRAALDAEEQSLLVLRLDRGLSWREVAEVMEAEGRSVDEATLRKRFERIKAKLATLARADGLVE